VDVCGKWESVTFVLTRENLKVRERLAVSEQTKHKFHMERFSLKKLNEVEDREQYWVEI
jgi:hypothetical protein